MDNKAPEKYTREWFVEQGKIGGYKTKELYGLKHYSKIRKKKVVKTKKALKALVKSTT